MKRQLTFRPLAYALAVILALAGGIVGGWAAHSRFAQPPLSVSRTTISDLIESLDGLERRTAAIVEILNDMAAGKVSADSDALNQLRDSMQEITEELGDVRSQLGSLAK